MIDVTYRGQIVGYSNDGTSITFLDDNPIAEMIKDDILNGQQIFISSRNIGEVEGNKCTIKDTVELRITKLE